MAKYSMYPEERDAILGKLEEVFEAANSQQIADTFETLDLHGIPNGAFQDYYLLSLLLDLQSKIIAVKKSLEARY